MNPFYRKPKPETMKKNRVIARTLYKEEMEWLKDNLDILSKRQPSITIKIMLNFCMTSFKIKVKKIFANWCL